MMSIHSILVSQTALVDSEIYFPRISGYIGHGPVGSVYKLYTNFKIVQVQKAQIEQMFNAVF